MDPPDTEFSIMLIMSTSITQMKNIINTDEDLNALSEAVENVGNDNTMRIKIIVRMKVISERPKTGTLARNHKVLLAGNNTPEKKKGPYGVRKSGGNHQQSACLCEMQHKGAQCLQQSK